MNSDIQIRINATDGTTTPRDPVLLLTNANAEMAVLIGKADGSFAAPLIYSVSTSSATSVATGDIDHDGVTDIVVTHGSTNAGNAGGIPLVYLLLGGNTGDVWNGSIQRND